MADAMRIYILIYFLLYFGIVFVLKSVIVAKNSGINPIVLPQTDDAYGLVGKYFKVTLLITFAYCIVFAFFPGIYYIFLPVPFPPLSLIRNTGATLLGLSFTWTALAQMYMKNSWRIGIDTSAKTELIKKGVFAISRNPIFLGMLVSLLGLFLLTPNGLTLLILVLGYILIQIQIRLEEEFLAKQHGQEYLDYRKKVRRLI